MRTHLKSVEHLVSVLMDNAVLTGRTELEAVQATEQCIGVAAILTGGRFAS